MERIVIEGGNRLEGELTVQGSKNSALPIIAATVATQSLCVIHNCPNLTDIKAALKILKYLGCSVEMSGNTLTVDSSTLDRYDVPENLMHEMRSSIVFLGPLISRAGKAFLSTPGGCEIGIRPINLHIYGMEKLGVKVSEEGGKLACRCEKGLKGADISLSFPSVGATENIIIAACTAVGETTIMNAAREPEIVDLVRFLNSCGARIEGAGEGTIVIHGVKKLHGAEHTVIPDRIVASTYMAAAAVTGGAVELKKIMPVHLSPVISNFEQAGCKIRMSGDELIMVAPKRLENFNLIRTMPYPGFPTDTQAIAMAMACVANGTSVIIETIFECRYKHVPELSRLGANINVEGRMAVIVGVNKLIGAQVAASDLRGGAALAVAGLAAEGKTIISQVKHIDRGCEAFEENLRALGANIRREIDEKGSKKTIGKKHSL
ncbi:MAG TPA: UDP-N-acetylglucosamine 1-carboxyvinyltransferase [Clostridia bacterium]|nr:UDP-N-acetylglucosamine 1-carboxyvinyltransferase [Clostridia bacterium]